MYESYHRFNETLLSGINSNTPEDFQQVATPVDSVTDSPKSAGQGSLVVQVTLAKGAIPVPDALVMVSGGPNFQEAIATLSTDQSGRTEKLVLSAPSSIYSQTPGSDTLPYSLYQIQVEKPGYYTETALRIPIFDQVDSIQPISLIPLSENYIKPKDFITDESYPNSL